MSHKLGAVVTTIQQPTEEMQCLASELDIGSENELFIIGDAKGPSEWDLVDGCAVDFWPLEAQCGISALARLLEENSYARKNLGYLAAMRWGAECIYETDDDTMPKPGWRRPPKRISAHLVTKMHGGSKWVNPYVPFIRPSFFNTSSIWPRGFPLDEVRFSHVALSVSATPDQHMCPIQNGLVDGEPDVDAIWRLLHGVSEYEFMPSESIVIERGCWAPTNSQNTWWFPEAYELMYLPTYCSIRMVDIWRGYVAQRCLWEMNRRLAFHAADVVHKRTAHDLKKDLFAEIDGYTHTKRFCDVLKERQWIRRTDRKLIVGDLLRDCYSALVKAGFFNEVELELVEAWLKAVGEVRS